MPGAWNSSKTRSRGTLEPEPSRPQPTAASRADGNKPLLHPRATSAPRSSRNELLAPAMAHGPTGLCRGVRSCPAIAQPAQPRPRALPQPQGPGRGQDTSTPQTLPKPFPRRLPGYSCASRTRSPCRASRAHPGPVPLPRAVPNLPRERALPLAQRRQAEVHTVKNSE